MSFVIFDTEYTSWEGCLQNGWRGLQKREVVQIAALKVDDDFNVVAEFNQLCQPIINPILSDYFVNLTGISNDDVAQKGVDFASAYQRFKAFVGNDVCYSHGWNGAFEDACDGAILAENLRLYGLPADNSVKYRNIAALFKQIYQKHNITVFSQSSGQIGKILGLQQQLADLHLDEHNALYDVYSILCGVRHFADDFAILKQK